DVVACEGDSGGPSFIYNESSLSYTITGIMSLAYGQSKCSAFPNVYMSVAYYKDWIESGYKTDSLISRDIFLPPLNQANSKISYLASEQN
ncbi:MAG: Trypsin, partial [Pseudomonadota bacterium]